MNVFYYLFIRIGTALLSAFWIFLGMTIVSIIKIKSQNLTDEFKDFKKNNKGPLVHIKFLYRNNKKLFVITWSFIVVAMLAVSFIAHGNQTYYDRNGNAYKSEYDIVYYDSDGNEYKLLKNDRYFTDANGDLTGLERLDSDGYVIDIFEIDVYVSGFAGIDYSKDPTEYYFDPDFVYWNENGEMFYKGRGNGENQTFPVAEAADFISID